MQCPSPATPWYSSFSTSRAQRTFRSIPSSCRIDLKAGDATFTVAVYKAHSSVVNVAFCAGFRMPACRDHPHARRAGVRKAPRQEIAGCGAPTVQRALWGFDAGVSVGEVEPTLAIGSL